MQNMQVDATKLQTLGGTELAPMSTTADKEVALKYARSTYPLVFVYETLALTRGCCIQFLSLYPTEVEYLYPPLTFLSGGVSTPYVEDGITFFAIKPQMS